MTRSLLVALLLAAPTLAAAQEVPPPTPAPTETPAPAPEEPPATESSETPAAEDTPAPVASPTPPPVPPPVAEQVEESIDGHKAPVPILTERMIGLTSRAVRFDWRRKTVGLAVTGGTHLELNNYRSRRIGGSARRPFRAFMGEVDVVWVQTSSSRSSDQLALTPYRQVGRPSRLELSVSGSYPLAEGVATARPGFFPATELVFSARGGARYLFYPGAIRTGKPQQVAEALFSPLLTTRELEFLEKHRPGGMKVDRARYNVLAGFSADIYFRAGGYVAPRVMLALPVTGTELGLWWELAIDAGWMF